MASNVATAVPQSMAPIVFSVAMAVRGDLNLGALMVVVMTTAQVVGAVPIAALGSRFSPASYARILAVTRTLAFVALAVLLGVGAPLAMVLVAVAVAGLVNGALFGVLRALLNGIVPEGKLARALGIVATANELVFVIAPALASLVVNISITSAVWIMAAASAVPIFALPRWGGVRKTAARSREGRLPRALAMWLIAATGSTACIASIEVGAVALAVSRELPAGSALLFVVPLCISSVAGGIWISVRNRLIAMRIVALMLLTTGCAAFLLSQEPYLAVMMGGAVLMGFFLAPLGTSISLLLDSLLPLGRRSEGFALLRTAQSVGTIIAASFVAFSSVYVALAAAGMLAGLSAIAVLYAQK